ncbi:zinc finger BED domain-containing protein RICESLEEPER 2-like [Spinacia oleracea]|uniref:Zinc finger BED domain-containing protein RICESLEEPER 2-like n=1 Tax=Spinacia oleracea TaxID=3562 RepID=A0A9R0IC37_SPIOL|nr:zinc finger BED domain-containing protein RICESLEEPER 2-like [Spinacia oleracea]
MTGFPVVNNPFLCSGKSVPLEKKLTEGREYVVRKGKKKATFWDYYIEYIEDGTIRAECKFCDKHFGADPNTNGTKNLKYHSERCLGNPMNKDKGKGTQTELYFQPGDGDKDDEDGDGKLKYGTVNLKELREVVVRMIIVDELPFRFVEKVGFKYMMSIACPRFHIPSRTTIARDCFQLYSTEKTKLKNMFKNCQKICVTTDTWTSIQRINYMCLTAHFIDNDWKLHKKIINFCPISSHKGEAIGKAVEHCLETWGIEDKLFTVTVDNASSNDVACAHLRRMVQRTGCVSDGKFLHIRCIAHIINLIVWDGIIENGVCIDRVRNAVKFVKNSPART